jgi:type 1 glutamine amidotransferase
MKRAQRVLALALMLAVVGSVSAQEKRKRVLVVGQSKGYQHESISTAMATLYNLGRGSGQWDTYFRTDCTALTKKPLKYGAKNLNDFDAVVFFTDGDLDMDASQKADLLSFVREDGKGFIGIHSAAITFLGWPEYGDMLGGYFDGHPWGIFNAPLVVEDPTFPGLRHLPREFVLKDEIYQIKDYSRDKVHVVMRLDASKLDLSAKGVHRKDGDFAVIWTRNYGKGRVLYNGLGHTLDVWERPEFQKMWQEQVQWALGISPGDALQRPASEPAPGFRIVGYLPDFEAADFDAAWARRLTDLMVFSAQPRADGSIDLSRVKNMPWTKLQEVKSKHGTRLILCLGGWGRCTHFAAVAGSVAKSKKLAVDAVRVCLDERLDGIDFDWEHPKDAREEAAYGALVAACRKEFESHGLKLSVTIAAWQKLPRSVFASVDAIQLMSYDNRGRHATFEAAKAGVNALLRQGVPKQKIVLGLPFYGRNIANADQEMTYREIVAKYKPGPEVDEVNSIYFNGPQTIRKKTTFALDSGLGGVMIWALGQDAPGGQSLLGAIDGVVKSDRK